MYLQVETSSLSFLLLMQVFSMCHELKGHRPKIPFFFFFEFLISESNSYIFFPNKNKNTTHKLPPIPMVEKIFSLNFFTGGSTATPAVANANKTKNMENPNKIDVIKRFRRRFNTSCVINSFCAGKTLRAPEMTVAMAQKKDKLLKTQNARKIG